jgi:hypothetical protein
MDTYSLPWQWLEVNGQFDSLTTLLLGRDPHYPVERRLGKLQNMFDLHAMMRNFAPTWTCAELSLGLSIVVLQKLPSAFICKIFPLLNL